jgi:hypothetical protein
MMRLGLSQVGRRCLDYILLRDSEAGLENVLTWSLQRGLGTDSMETTLRVDTHHDQRQVPPWRQAWVMSTFPGHNPPWGWGRQSEPGPVSLSEALPPEPELTKVRFKLPNRVSLELVIHPDDSLHFASKGSLPYVRRRAWAERSQLSTRRAE